MNLPISLNEWREGGEHFNYRGHEIFFRRGGDWSDPRKPVLLLVHGFPTASYDWIHQWEVLSEQFRLATLDLIGFGFSAKPADYDYSIMDQADLIESFLDRLGVALYHVLAHDYGDTVAQELLARCIERAAADTPCASILSVCFLNGGLFPEQHRATFTQRLLNGPFGPLVSRLMTRNRFEAGFCEVFGPDTKPDKAELDDFWSLVDANGGMRPIGHKLISYIGERRANRDRWVGALQISPVPLRVIDGALDPVSGAHMVAHYRKLVPDPDTVLLGHVGHYPQWEAPKEVLDAFMKFQSDIVNV